MNSRSFAIYAMLCAESQLAEAGATGEVKPKKSTGFLAILAGMKAKELVPEKKGKPGEVSQATPAAVEKEIPELIGGLWDVVDGKPVPKVAANTGRPSVIWTSRIKINGGCVFVHRAGVLVTPSLAKFIIERFGGHNRRQTPAAIKRYADEMASGNWPFVGNTAGFVVDKKGALFAIGQCNGGHTLKAVIESGVSVEMDFYFGVPESFANLADVNIPRTGKDVIGRTHRFDELKDTSELDGQPIGVTLTDADVKAISDIHSQAIRIVACLLAYKPIKDSEPLGPSAISSLDRLYGDVLSQCVRDVYLLDKLATFTNDKGKPVSGGLKRLMSLSHAAALMAVVGVTGDVIRDEKTGQVLKVGKLELDPDAIAFVAQFFADMVNGELLDEENPAVCLRNALLRFKYNKVTNQNLRWYTEKGALYSAMLLANADQIDGFSPDMVPDYDVESLVAIAAKDAKVSDYAVYFDTCLDKKKPEAPAVPQSPEGEHNGESVLQELAETVPDELQEIDDDTEV